MKGGEPKKENPAPRCRAGASRVRCARVPRPLTRRAGEAAAWRCLRHLQERAKAMDRGEIAIALLRAIGIQELEYSLDGGGDSGDSTLESIQHVDGRLLDTLPNLPPGIDGTGPARPPPSLLTPLV